MEKCEIINLLKSRIKSCYENLQFAKDQKGYRKDWTEGFRCRVDELILMYQEIQGISFVDACKELNINYQDINVQEDSTP